MEGRPPERRRVHAYLRIITFIEVGRPAFLPGQPWSNGTSSVLSRGQGTTHIVLLALCRTTLIMWRNQSTGWARQKQRGELAAQQQLEAGG